MATSGHGMVTRFRGAHLVKEDGTLLRKDLWVRDGRILDPLRLFYEEKKEADKTIDCSGLLISPGLIDIQINGAFGVDFADLNEDNVADGISQVSKALLQFGVTAYVPTIVTSSPEYYMKVLPLMTPREGGPEGAAVLGVHCEGPFINPQKKGAHTEEFIKPSVNHALLQSMYGSQLENIAILTLAPELEGSVDTIEWLRENKKDLVISIGHSMANLKQAEQAVRKGASLITHLFNAMLPFHHRDPGIVGLLTSLEIEKVFYGLIADGLHTDPAVQRIAYKARPEGVVLVTDALGAMGLPESTYTFGKQTIEVKDGVAWLAGTSTLAGSITSMDSCVRKFKEATGCPPGEALNTASLHPAQAMGLEKSRGTLSPGAMADLAILDSDLNVQATCIAGEVVWAKPGSRFANQRNS